jgi:hypothetical protein
MKIVNLETFRALPEGTLFMKYEPCFFGPLCIKDKTWEHDWNYIPLDDIDAKDSGEFGDKLQLAQEAGISVDMDFETVSRDGCFDKEQLFAVYEPTDHLNLIKVLVAAFKTCWDERSGE